MKFFLLLAFALMMSLPHLNAQNLITDEKETGAFAIVSVNRSAPIYVDDKDYWLVQKAASLFQNDVAKVTGTQLQLINAVPVNAKNIIIIGSLNQSSIIKQLVSDKKLNIDNIKG